MPESRIITVVSNIDNHYVMPLTVTIRSVVENLSPGYNLHAVVLEDGVTAENKAILEASLEGLGVTVSWHSVRLSDHVFTLASHPGGVAATYFKLYMGDILPEHITRVIYLDADTVVCKDLLDLWNTNLDGFILGAVADSRWQSERMRKLAIPEASFARPDSYFNCGVLLIDMVRWRELKILERAIYFANRYRKHLWLVDQDLINCVINGQYKILPPEWNLLDFYGNDYRAYWATLSPSCYSADMFAAANQSPGIVHYSGMEKPWLGCCAAHNPAWFLHYYSHTQWPEYSSIPAPTYAHIMQARYKKNIIPMLKTWYRELELGRWHGDILKNLVLYLLQHPFSALIFLRILLRYGYWALRVYSVPRIAAFKFTRRQADAA